MIAEIVSVEPWGQETQQFVSLRIELDMAYEGVMKAVLGPRFDSYFRGTNNFSRDFGQIVGANPTIEELTQIVEELVAPVTEAESQREAEFATVEEAVGDFIEHKVPAVPGFIFFAYRKGSVGYQNYDDPNKYTLDTVPFLHDVTFKMAEGEVIRKIRKEPGDLPDTPDIEDLPEVAFGDVLSSMRIACNKLKVLKDLPKDELLEALDLYDDTPEGETNE